MTETANDSLPSISKYLRYGFQGAILGVVAIALVLFFTVDSETLQYLERFNWWFAPVIFLAVSVAWLCNGGRFWINAGAVGHPLKYRQALSVSLSTEFGVAASPAGMGGSALRLYLLKKAYIPLPASASMLAADLVVDLTFFSLLTPIAIFFIVRDQDWVRMVSDFSGWQMALALVLVMGGFCLVILFFKSGGWARLGHRVASSTPHGRRRRWPGKFRHFRWAIRRTIRRTISITCFLFRNRRKALSINFVLASTQWLCRYSVLPLVLLAFGSLKNPFPLIFVQGFLFFFAMAMFLPGGGGGVEVVTAFILGYFVPLPMVGLVLLIWRFSTYHLYLLVGGAVFFYVSGHLDQLFPPEAEHNQRRIEPLVT